MAVPEILTARPRPHSDQLGIDWGRKYTMLGLQYKEPLSLSIILVRLT